VPFKETVMKKISFALALVAALALAGSALAQAPVNIVYPINGGVYPIHDPIPGALLSAYFTSSFSVTCQGGQHNVQWGFDSNPAVGSSTFYDQTSAQFVHKLPGGVHTFWVISDCGTSQVKFKIGN
jgi:hypothetical protein